MLMLLLGLLILRLLLLLLPLLLWLWRRLWLWLRRLLWSIRFLLCLRLRRLCCARGRHGLNSHGLDRFLEFAAKRRVGARHYGLDVAKDFFLPGFAATREPAASRTPRAALTLYLLDI